jgi:hypothetical protein
MLTSLARLLILTYAGLVALLTLVALLPGDPNLTGSPGPLVAGVVIQALIVWRLLHRSPIAWFLAVLGSGFYVVSVVLVGGPYETTLIITTFIALMQALVLFTPDVLSYVFGYKKTAAH